jgi:putative transposase
MRKKNDGHREHQIWQRDNYPTGLWNAEVIWTKIRYIHRNPMRACWVAEAPHYLYSSALNYTGKSGLLPITLYEGIVYKT